MERLKKDQSTVKNRKIGRLESANDELMKAKTVIKSPIMANGIILRIGRGRSIIMAAIMVMNMIVYIPVSKPKNLAIIAAKTINNMVIIACFHWGLPVGFESIFNLPMKPFFSTCTPLIIKIYN